ncbi:MAG: NosD domain-containing protein [Candidatus Hodarchaeales archaeon]
MNTKFIISSLTIILLSFSFVFSIKGMINNTSNILEIEITNEKPRILRTIDKNAITRDFSETNFVNNVFEDTSSSSIDEIVTTPLALAKKNHFIRSEDSNSWSYQTELGDSQYSVLFLESRLGLEIRNIDSPSNQISFCVDFLNARKCSPEPQNVDATGINCEKLLYREIYPNIDLLYYVVDGELKYEFRVYPYGDPAQIKLRYSSIKGMQLIKMGQEVLIQTTQSSIKEHGLNVFQKTTEGELAISARYALVDFNTLGFDIGLYDTSKTLIIDPFISVEQTTKMKISALTPHAPIVITNNNDFRTQADIEAWPGNGSILSPFIISGYNISGSINISNVEYYFEIRDNFLVSSVDGIIISNSSHIKIINNTINSQLRGIILSDSTCSEAIITDNKLKGFTKNGLEIHSFSNTIQNNVLEGDMGDTSEPHSPVGFRLMSNDGLNNTIRWNTITNCVIAIKIEQESNLIDANIIQSCNTGIYISNDFNNVTNNNITTCTVGITTDEAKYCYYVNNTIFNMLQYGINITNSFNSDSFFMKNRISHCGYQGIRVIESTKIHLISNTLDDSIQYNIYVNNSNNINISYNTLTNSGIDIYFNDSTPCFTNFIYRNHYSSSYGIPVLTLEGVFNGTDIQENETISFSFQYAEDGLYYSWDGQSAQILNSPYTVPKVASEGIHVLESWVYDANGNCLKNYYEFYLNYDPIIDVSPDNKTFSYYHRLTWLISDVAGIYSIYRNDTLSATGSWTTGEPIWFELEGSTKGNHNFKIVITDNHGAVIEHVSIVKVDEYVTRDPLFVNDSTVQDLALAEGWRGNGSQSDPYIISWYNITGNPQDRLITINSDSSFLIENNILSQGKIGIYATSTNDSTIRDNIIRNSSWGVTLQFCDNVTVSTNDISECSDGGLSLTVTNSTVVNNNIKNNGAGILFASSLYSSALNNTLNENYVGIVIMGNTSLEIDYSLNITISGNHIFDNYQSGLNITKAANTCVSWNFFEGNYGYGVLLSEFAGTTTLHHNCFLGNGDKTSQAMDNGTTNFWYDPSLNEGNLWYDHSSSSYYTIDGTSGAIDSYPLSILSINSPSGFSMPIGEPGHSLIWLQSEENGWNEPILYELYDNGSRVETGEWLGNMAIFMLNEIKPHGVHNLTLVVIYRNLFGYSNRYTTESVWMTILPDTIPPEISSPQDKTIVEGTLNNSVIWTCSDYNPTYAVITRNNTIIINKTWISGNIVLNLDDLTIGTYNFTLTLYDIGPNPVSDSVIVKVIELPPDNTKPFVNRPADLEIYENTPGSIVWEVHDDWPANYTIYRNQSLIVQQGYWSTGIVRYSFNSLPIGIWNFTLVLFDLTGNMNSSSVIVIVKQGIEYDSTAPVISHPPNKTISIDQQGEYVDFNIFDEHPSSIVVYIDEKLVYQSDWTSPNQKVRIYLDDLSIGKHILTVTASDIFENTASRTITIMIVGDDSPPVVSEPTIADGTITWEVTDANPGTYTLILLTNNTIIETGSYTNGTIKYTIGHFSPGTYTIRLIVYDRFGHYTISDATFKDTDSNYRKTSGFEIITLLPLLVLLPQVRRKKRDSGRND